MTSRVLVKSEKENGDDKFLSTNISQDFSPHSSNQGNFQLTRVKFKSHIIKVSAKALEIPVKTKAK